MRSPSNVSHFRCLSQRNKAGAKGARELERGVIESAACATFPLFDGAEKETFWLVDPRLWWSPFHCVSYFHFLFLPLALPHSHLYFISTPLSLRPALLFTLLPVSVSFQTEPFSSFLPSHLHLHFCPPQSFHFFCSKNSSAFPSRLSSPAWLIH